MLTAYDYPTAKILDEIGVDYILVGDSLSMVVLGYHDTKSVTVRDMIHHTQAVARGAKNSFIIADLPLGTYETPEDALKNAKLLINAGARGIKIEGYKQDCMNMLIHQNIPVMGHLGLLPQTAEKHSVQGREQKEAEKIFQDAVAMDTMGLLAIVLECIPEQLAKRITETLQTPTIGIGAGRYCDGQVLVLHDVIGLSDFQGKFIKRYGDVKGEIKRAVSEFKREVITGEFPEEKNVFQ